VSPTEKHGGRNCHEAEKKKKRLSENERWFRLRRPGSREGKDKGELKGGGSGMGERGRGKGREGGETTSDGKVEIRIRALIPNWKKAREVKVERRREQSRRITGPRESATFDRNNQQKAADEEGLREASTWGKKIQESSGKNPLGGEWWEGRGQRGEDGTGGVRVTT